MVVFESLIFFFISCSYAILKNKIFIALLIWMSVHAYFSSWASVQKGGSCERGPPPSVCLSFRYTCSIFKDIGRIFWKLTGDLFFFKNGSDKPQRYFV